MVVLTRQVASPLRNIPQPPADLPTNSAAIWSLGALTLHFSVLSILLHISRHSAAPGRGYHASVVSSIRPFPSSLDFLLTCPQAVALTELGKILVSIILIFWTGELRARMADKRRERNPLSQGSPAWLDASGGGGDSANAWNGNGNGTEKGDDSSTFLLRWR